MKNTVSPILIALLFLNFTLASEIKDELPFKINYSLPLKVQSTQHSEKYDFAEYAAGEDVVQLKQYNNMTIEKAKKMMGDKKFYLGSMFKDQPSPYPGVLTTAIGCPEELVPKPNEDTLSIRLFYKLLATGNLIYGNCNPKDNTYSCAYGFFFCAEKNQAYELKIFTPIAKPSFNYENLISSISCK